MRARIKQHPLRAGLRKGGWTYSLLPSCIKITLLDCLRKRKCPQIHPWGSSCTVCAHCVRTAHVEAGILTQVIRLVVTVLFPRNPFQKNEQSKNI